MRSPRDLAGMRRVALVALVAGVLAAPCAETSVGVAQPGEDDRCAAPLDLDAWDRVLAAHARGGGFDYAGFVADASSRADLRRVLDGVATMPDDAPLAAWIDAYDALVIDAIAARWPLRSVRDVPGFFDHVEHRVAGRRRTLDAIENGVIRARFRDARVHAALVCGARSCPPLPTRALRDASLDASLDALARAWVRAPDHARVEGGRVRASAIFGWYREDFERDAGSVLGWLRRYDPARFDGVTDASVVELPYDWSLNTPR